MNHTTRIATFCLLLTLLAGPARAQRTVQSLNGTWQIAESVRAEAMPDAYDHEVPVPGLVSLAEPAFEDVGAFYGREFLQNQFAPDVDKRVQYLDTSGVYRRAGIARQERGYFWHRTRFEAPAERAVARLRIAKAKYGVAVWLNGERVSTVGGEQERLGPFTPGTFDLTGALRWEGENELVVRIGAHPGVLPLEVPAGTDQEKARWIPGIYDAVEVRYMDSPVIEHVQVAPRIDSSLILVQTHLKNYGSEEVAFPLRHEVQTWEEGRGVGEAAEQRLTLAVGADTTLTRRIRVPDAHLWTPEDPFLYALETSTGGDSKESRFGMRSFRFDTATRRAYLNGEPYFLRGSNITLHRFFEDPDMGTKPWDEAWVRKLLGEIPDRMHWNAFRFCIGPVPERWLEIADEEGLLIQNEFQVWKYREQWDTETVIEQYKDWVRDNWNHPSVAIWDASNETHAEVYAEEIIPAVRPLDLSNRPWDNGYNLPAAPNDPIEDHPYVLSMGGIMFESGDTGDAAGYPGYKQLTGSKSTNSPHPTGHAAIINEYGWLWLHRDGTPTGLTQKMWAYLAGSEMSPEERLRLQSYLLAGETEYWRAHRNFAGVLHFVYLTSDFPGALTADHFADLDSLTLHASFADYMGEAFKPLGVFINKELWTPAGIEGAAAAAFVERGPREFAVMMINDYGETKTGTLALTLEAEGGEELARAERPFAVPAAGQMSYELAIDVPAGAGRATLKATATPESGEAPTVSRRWVHIVEPGNE